MNLRELNYIVVLAEEGSISKAAERLFIAQSSLSQFLQQYENMLGTVLFIRTSKGIKPTLGGSEFIETAKEILNYYRQAENKLWDSENLKGGRVVFGISSFRGDYIVPKVLTRFYEKYPKVKVDIIEANSMALEELLLDAKIDLAVIALPLTKLKSEVEPLKSDEVLLVVNNHHPLTKCVKQNPKTKTQYIDLEDAAKFEFILSDTNTMLGKTSRKLFSEKGIKYQAENTNITASLGASMARAGLGIAFTYDSCAEDYEDVSYYSIGKERVFLELVLAYSPFGYRPKSALALGAVLHEYI